MNAEEKREVIPSPEQFNRNACIGYSLVAFTPKLFPAFSGGHIELEKKFLSDTIEERKEGYFTLQGIDDFLKSQRAEFLQQAKAGKLTDEELGRLDLANKENQRKIGLAIRDRVSQLGILESLDETEISKRFRSPEILLEKKGNTFPWRVVQDKNDQYVLAFERAEGEEKIEVVEVDRLFNQNAEFIQAQLKKFYESQAFGDQLNYITYNLGLHRIDQTRLVAAPLRELAKHKEPEKVIAEAGKVATFLKIIRQLDEDFKYQVDDFVHGFDRAQEALPDGRNAFLDTYLKHLMSCSGSKPESRSQAKTLWRAYSLIVSEALKKEEKPPENYPFNQKLFQNPIGHTSAYLNCEEKETKKAMEEDQKFHTFLVAIAEAREEAAIATVLKEEVPDLYDKWGKFKEWLGKDILKRSRHEEIMAKVTRELKCKYGVIKEEEVKSEIEKELYMDAVSSRGGKEEWVRDKRQELRVKIRDERLADLLSVLAIKRAQESLSQETDWWVKDRADLQIKQLAYVLYEKGGIEPKYQQRIVEAEQELREYNERRIKMASYLEQTKIPSETIDALATSLERQAGEWQYSDFNTYKLLFNCLHMNKLDIIEMDSPVFRSLLKTLFPRIREEQWKICRESQ